MNIRVLDGYVKTTRANKGKGERRVGPSSDGPRICINCHKPFAKGEAWTRMTSPADPEFGSYAIGIHCRCLGITPGTK